MYAVDDRDLILRLDVPPSDVGAPLPHVLADEGTVVLAYLVRQPPPPGWDGTDARIVGPQSEGIVALVRFELVHAHMLGPPNDEAFEGHPLASRGLEPYTAYEVVDSSWIRALERMNSVHEYHDAREFEQLRHFIFAFHDSTFECVARGFEVETRTGSLSDSLGAMQRLLEGPPEDDFG
jgi:hypothetical protein